MLQISLRDTESKTSPRHLNFLKQLKKTTEVLSLLRVLVLDTSGHPTSAPQYTVTVTNIQHYAHNNQKYMHITIRNLGIASDLRFCLFSNPRGSHGRRKNLDGFS